jgi:hypothetical protein
MVLAAYALLLAQGQAISDPELRNSFMHNVTENMEIFSAYHSA